MLGGCHGTSSNSAKLPRRWLTGAQQAYTSVLDLAERRAQAKPGLPRPPQFAGRPRTNRRRDRTAMPRHHLDKTPRNNPTQRPTCSRRRR
ncbi:jg313 [Pararge aegeria aegeria]|uniref:Jg313 protein n=1 Tax=Pararge aegeria aegeria TaxID=348720 RepID=A0A8S4QR55_9NEOP|nr:jg313 [Pararge aegeria aegeria]